MNGRVAFVFYASLACVLAKNAEKDENEGEECGRRKYNEDRIIGTFADPGEFPWMAMLIYSSGNGSMSVCGGSLISRNYVITAAHCFKTKYGSPNMVRLGEYDIRSNKEQIQDIPIEKYTLHSDYSSATNGRPNDIALIRLKDPANYTDSIKPICLPNAELTSKFLKSKHNLLVAGWGLTEIGEPSVQLKKASVPFIELSTCGKIKSNYTFEETQFCAGGGKEDSCNGDSGGPIMDAKVDSDENEVWYIVGIVSWGPTACATRNDPAVYTKVVSFLSWIQSNMN